MSTQASSIKNILMFHLVHHMGDGQPMKLGTTEELQGVVKIMDSPVVARAIAARQYPRLHERQYLVACVDNWLDVRVWGIYASSQIEAMEKNRRSPQVNDIKWRILEIPEELEAELRKGIIEAELRRGIIEVDVFDANERLPPTPCPHCTIL
jgi:hypothetical protein